MDHKRSIVTKIRELTITLIFSLFLIGLVCNFRGSVIVNGQSMYPAFENGQAVKYKKQDVFYGGDVIIFWIKDGNVRENLIKRVIAVGGDTIRCEDGKVYVNNALIEETYLSDTTVTEDFDAVTVAEGEYFVMGDNRQNSKDSRMFGCINQKQIRGKVEE